MHGIRHTSCCTRWATGLAAMLLLMAPVSAAGQAADSSRTAQLRAARQANQATPLEPEARSRFEAALLWIEEKRIPAQVTGAVQAAWRVLPGGVGPETGLGGRLAYVPYFDRADVDVFLSAGGSVRGYWIVEATAGFRQRRWFGYGYTRWRSRRDEFGITDQNTRLLDDGFQPGDRIVYDVEDGTAGGVLGLRLSEGLTLAAGGAFMSYDPNPDPGMAVSEAGPALPFSASTDYLGLTGHLIWDTRDVQYLRGFGERYAFNTDAFTDRPLNPHRGTLLAASVQHFIEQTSTAGDFMQYTIEAQQYVSIRNDYHTLALRHRSVFTDRLSNAQVPFYQLPYLGGNHSLRGFSTYRFRDVHALLYNAEYRWRVWIMMDLVLFADAGKTFAEADQWGVTDLETSLGGGLRVTTTQSTLMRFEVARSPEDVRFIVTFNAAF